MFWAVAALIFFRSCQVKVEVLPTFVSLFHPFLSLKALSIFTPLVFVPQHHQVFLVLAVIFLQHGANHCETMHFLMSRITLHVQNQLL